MELPMRDYLYDFARDEWADKVKTNKKLIRDILGIENGAPIKSLYKNGDELLNALMVKINNVSKIIKLLSFIIDEENDISIYGVALRKAKALLQ